MYPHPYSNDPNALGLMVAVFAPVVLLLCWLYNARRLGKFKKPQRTPPGIARKSSRKNGITILFGILLGILLGLTLRFVL